MIIFVSVIFAASAVFFFQALLLLGALTLHNFSRFSTMGPSYCYSQLLPLYINNGALSSEDFPLIANMRLHNHHYFQFRVFKNRLTKQTILLY